MRCTLLCLALLVVHVTWAQYVTYEAGEIPLIITASHGGSARPSDFTTRNHGCYISETNSCVYGDCSVRNKAKCRAGLLRDSQTKEIAQGVFDYIVDNMGKRPYMIRTDLHRSKLDANREIEEAAQGDPKAIEQYNIFHGFVRQAIDELKDVRAMLLDIHGYKGSYTLLGSGQSKYNLKNSRFQIEKSTIRALQEENCGTNDTCSFDYVIGQNSLGKYLDEKDESYDVVPSPDIPSPPSKYFSGGFIVKTYGSVDGGNVDALQVEIPSTIRSNDTTVPQFAQDLGQAVLDYMNTHQYL